MMYILGLSGGLDHDASACILCDGQILAMAEEERFTRQKHAWYQAPVHAVAYCLAHAGITLADVDCIALGWHPIDDPTWPTMASTHRTVLEHEWFKPYRARTVEAVRHHLAHAAAAYYTSGFDAAAILVVDGQGEEEATTLAYGQGLRINVLQSYNATHSLGAFYTAVSNYLGFEDGEEGKLMGLAPYGQDRYRFSPIQLHKDGYSIDIQDVSHDSPGLMFPNAKRHWLTWLEQRFGSCNPVVYHHSRLTSRPSKSIEFSAMHKDIAASAQAQLEEVILHLAALVVSQTGCRKLVIAGGVGLNCSANGRLRSSGIIDDLYIFPASGDAGTSAGAALSVYHTTTHCPPSAIGLEQASFGPSYNSDEIGGVLAQCGIKARRPANIGEEAAKLIAAGKIVGWFQGRMEFGPRALGCRSILASPTSQKMHDSVNAVKGRENWRPLAPSILQEKAVEYLEDTRPAPFMLTSCQVNPEKLNALSAVTHVDGSCRPQLVTPSMNLKYWELIYHFERETSLPVILNTSFNLGGEPIVCTPTDALRSFWSSGLDALILEDFVIEKL